MPTDVSRPSTRVLDELLAACRDGNEQVVQQLLTQHPELLDAREGYTENGHSPLLLACQHNHYSLVERLLAKGAVFDTMDLFDEQPLLLSAQLGHESLVRLLLDYGDSPHARRLDMERAALHVAAHCDQRAIIALLLAHGVDVDSADVTGATALHIAARAGHDDVVAELIAVSPNIETVDVNGVTPFVAAVFGGHCDVAAQLIALGANMHFTIAGDDSSLLHSAVRNKHRDMVRLLLAEGFDVNSSNNANGVTPLYRAVENHDTATTAMLLQYGAESDLDGCKPLSITETHGFVSTRMMRTLQAHGVDVSSIDTTDAWDSW